MQNLTLFVAPEPNGSNATEEAAPVAKTNIRFPGRFEFEAKTRIGVLHKLEFVDHVREGTVTPYNRSRTEGYMFATGGQQTFITQKPTTAALSADDILQVPVFGNLDSTIAALEAGAGRWLRPRPRTLLDQTIDESERRCVQIVETWKDRFALREEREEGGALIPGLRRPQVGAVYATLAHWSVTEAPATIVMPTGTGKTETMLALLVCARLPKVMVIVPTSALRDQLTEKFLTLGVLAQCGCLAAGADLPMVGSLTRRPQTVQEVDDIFRRANVIVTTMQIAGQCEPAMQRRMAELCSHLFIDEAHHIAAPTWNGFKQRFVSKPILQFTATPFRTDGKRVDGRFIYTYPLAKAQEEGYFKPIQFIPVREYDRDDADRTIAATAAEQLQQDLAAGLDHVLLAPVARIERAQVVHGLYENLLPECNPVLIHSETPASERKELLRRLRSKESRVVVCVDMFGEGFDFPELKVAALHDRHKSLAITLQFVGRFTRTAGRIGDASVIANIADEEISYALRNLYAEDADWNTLLRILAQGTTERARRRAEILEGFSGSLPEIPLQTLLPRMSAVIYRTTCDRWDPLKVIDALPGTQLHAGPVVNPAHNLAVFVTRDEEAIRWGTIKQIQNLQWNLYVLHWNERATQAPIHQQLAAKRLS